MVNETYVRICYEKIDYIGFYMGNGVMLWGNPM